MNRVLSTCLLTLAIALHGAPASAGAAPAEAGAPPDALAQAQQVLAAAQSAGAETNAPTLYNDAEWRMRFAQENWNSPKSETQEQARLRAEEALWAGRAALAKAQWLSSNLAIKQLQADITKFGGSSGLTLQEEPPAIDYGRGTTLQQHIAAAQSAIDQAKTAGADQIAGNDLKPAQDDLATARKIASANKVSESADHLAYLAEMMARRAYYLARANESSRNLPALQLERTKLAQAASEQQVAADRTRLEQAEKDRAALQQQLATEQANRQAEQAQLDQLKQQLEESRRQADARAEADRQARVQAEQQLDQLNQKYQAAIATGNTADVETMRRQVEDQQIALRAIQEREKLNEQSMSSEIDSLRSQLQSAKQQGTASSQQLTDQQAELDRRAAQLQTLQKEREADLAHRAEVEKQNQAAVVEAQRKRDEAEAQAQQLRAQLQQAQQQAVQAQQQAQQQMQQTQAELDKSRQQAQQAQAEVDRMRQELAQRDADARQLKMQQALSKFAKTSTTDRGLLVSLPSSALFASGKVALKPAGKKTLQRIVDQLKSDAAAKVAIEGLSDKRTDAVREFLVNGGVPAERISVTSNGKNSKPRVALTITNR